MPGHIPSPLGSQLDHTSSGIADASHGSKCFVTRQMAREVGRPRNKDGGPASALCNLWTQKVDGTFISKAVFIIPGKGSRLSPHTLLHKRHISPERFDLLSLRIGVLALH